MADEEKILLVLEADNNASDKIDEVTRSIQNLNREANGSGGSGGRSGVSGFVSGLEDGISRVNSVTRHYNSTMAGFNRSVVRIVKDAGSAIYDFTSDSISNFTEFSQQHARTLGAMAADYDKSAESQRRFFEDGNKLRQQAIQYGTYGFDGQGSLMSVSEISQAQEALVKAGVPANDILDTNIMKDILTFAQGNELGIEEAVETAVTLGNQFNIPKDQWGNMLDMISHTADMSVVDVSDITQSLKWASGISAGLDRPLEEVLGMITILGDFGLKGSQAGTGIQAVLTRLLTGDSTVITQAQADVAPGNALEKFYEFEAFAKPDGNLLPMTEVIPEMNAIMEDMTDEEQAWFAKKLFGLYQMKSAYALMNGEDVNLDDVIKEIKEQSTGTNQSKFDTMLNSQYGQLTSLGNLWEGVKTDVGARLSPFVDAIRDELFSFLSNDGNYDINFDNLRGALDESCDLIEEKYGTAISNAVQNIGDLAIDFTEVMTQLAPEMGKGALSILSSMFDGNPFNNGEDGNPSIFSSWSSMISGMDEAVQGLPEDLQGFGSAVVGATEMLGGLVTLNIASEIAELVSSVLQILTIAGGAVINVAGAVVVNGNATNPAAGVGGAGAAGAGSTGAGVAGATSRTLSGSTMVGSADDVAEALGMSADDVVSGLGGKLTYTIDDIANGLGTSADDVINAYGSSIDDVISSWAGSADDVVRSGSGLFSKLSGAGKVLGVLGTAWQAWSTGKEAYGDFKSGDTKGGTEAIGGGASSLGGGYAGAAIGTAVAPGFGTVIGALLGSIGGDKLGRELTGDIYDNFNDAKNNYGTALAGLPIIGGLWQKDGTLSHQQSEASMQADRKNQEETYGIKPSDYGLPQIFDKYYNGKTGEIPWENITRELQLARDYPLNNGRYETKYGMDVDEAKSWQDSQAYQDYITAIGGAKQVLVETQQELGAQMVQIRKGDAGYEADKDTSGYGYSVWTGTQKELETWLSGQQFIGTGAPSTKGMVDNPYILGDLAGDIKSAITSSLASQQNQTSDKGAEAKNIQADGATINAGGGVNLTGEVKMPDLSATLRSIMPNGYAALSEKGQKEVIENEINNQIQIDDSVTMQPSFSVSAPQVNVNVSCTGATAVVSQSILNPGQASTLNNWYSRTSSQYGSTTKG